MQVQINGEQRELESGTTVAQLLQKLDTSPPRVAVEVNRELVTRKLYDQTQLHDGDRIEIVTFVGGG